MIYGLRCSALLTYLFFVSSLCFSINVFAQNKPLRIAVSANFSPTLAKLLPIFEQETGIKTEMISAATGVLFQQLNHGAPFDVFLSADSERPKLLEQQDLVIAGTRKTYAVGQLALWSGVKIVSSIEELKKIPTRIAIANPNIAPYGKAAKEVLLNLGVWQEYQGKLVQGVNVNQTFQQLRSQAATLGIVSYSQLTLNNLTGIVIPQHLYQPLNQQMVLMKNSKIKDEAQRFSEFLLSLKSQTLIAQSGYKVIEQ